MIQYCKQHNPSWFENPNSTQMQRLLILKQLISNLRLINKKEAITSYLSLVVVLFPELSQHQIREELAVSEHELKTAVR
jgi:hypothetical protein